MSQKNHQALSQRWSETLRRVSWRTRATCVVVIIAVILLSFVLPSFAQPQATVQIPLVTRDHEVLMEKKLVATQKVIAGIAHEDFVKIEKQAQLLRLLSQEAAWNVIQTPEYVRLSGHFRGTADQLMRAAKDRNIDAVGLAYVTLSVSCIDCHRHARKELSRIGAKTPPVGTVLPQRR